MNCSFAKLFIGYILFSGIFSQSTTISLAQSVTQTTAPNSSEPITETTTQAALHDAEKLTREGKYEEALQKFLWFWEASKQASGMRGVRVSFALAAWAELGKKYPAARAALVEIRDKNRDMLINGQGDFNTFQEFSSINSYLKEDNSTYEVFRVLIAKYPNQARNYSMDISVKRVLLAHHDYNTLSSFIPDPDAAFETIRNMRDMNLLMARTNPSMKSPEFLKVTDNIFESDTRQLIEILVGAGKESEAEAVQKKALGILDSAPIRTALTDAKKIVEASKT